MHAVLKKRNEIFSDKESPSKIEFKYCLYLLEFTDFLKDLNKTKALMRPPIKLFRDQLVY